jgi:hypothetical protein
MSDGDGVLPDYSDERPWPAHLNKMGYSRDGWRGKDKGIDPVKHVLHTKGDVPAIAMEAFIYWRDTGIKRIHVRFRNGAVWSIDLELFETMAHRLDGRFGAQLWVNRDLWEKR